MAVKINWTQNVQVVNGPKVSGSGTVEASACDFIEVTVPANDGTNDGTAAVEVQPSGTVGKVKFLLVKSDRYTDLTYDIDTSLTGVKLDAQLLLIGEGALTMAGGGAPQVFAFTNAGDEDAHVQIVLVRDATP